jgi:quercetin dioxygenase-like cupin family protein
MKLRFSGVKTAFLIGSSLLIIGALYASTALELWVGTSEHIGLWNGPATLTARTLQTKTGETTGPWHYHPGFVYNVVRQGTITVEDGCGNVQSYSAGQAFETSEGRVHRAYNLGGRMPSSRICSSGLRAGRSRCSFPITSGVAVHRVPWTNVRAMDGQLLIFRANSQIKDSASPSLTSDQEFRCLCPRIHCGSRKRAVQPSKLSRRG